MRTLTLPLLLALFLAGSAFAEECWLCRKTNPPYPLTTISYTESGIVKHPVCDVCRKTKAACDICRGPSNAKAEADGRSICPECKTVAVDTPIKVEALYKDVQRFVDGLTGLKVDSLPPVRLVLSDEMETKFVEGSGRSMRPHAFYQPYNPEMIYVLTGHSPYDLGPTLAHEFTHAWQSRHCPQQDRMLKEGFATWVGYKYALSKGYHGQATGMLALRDPDYGEGLRRCLEIEKKSGVKGLLDFVRKNSRFP